MVLKPCLLVLSITLFSFITKTTANDAPLSNKNSSPFGFLENLKGSHKGDKVKGINDLKKYLTKYGYLDCKNHIHSDDDFDDHLEEAFKVYQINFNLNPTGNLDEETISTMMKPRCGVADIVDGTTSMRAASMKHNYSEIPIRLRYKLPSGNYKWPPNKYNLTYAFLPTISAVFKGAPIKKAFGVWKRHTKFKFTKSQNPDYADIKLSSHKRNLLASYDTPFDGPYGELAHAAYPVGGYLHFDGDENWIASAPLGTVNPIDCEGVGLHEIGHLLGLDHTSVRGAVMFPNIIAAYKDLHPDDIQGIKALYKF